MAATLRPVPVRWVPSRRPPGGRAGSLSEAGRDLQLGFVTSSGAGRRAAARWRPRYPPFAVASPTGQASAA